MLNSILAGSDLERLVRETDGKLWFIFNCCLFILALGFGSSENQVYLSFHSSNFLDDNEVCSLSNHYLGLIHRCFGCMTNELHLLY